MAEIISFPTTENSREVSSNSYEERSKKSIFSQPIGAEIILEDGSRRYFRCRSNNKNRATYEVLLFIESLEKHTGDRVMWRFRGESTYHMSTDVPENLVKKSNLKEKCRQFFNYFFELD